MRSRSDRLVVATSRAVSSGRLSPVAAAEDGNLFLVYHLLPRSQGRSRAKSGLIWRDHAHKAALPWRALRCILSVYDTRERTMTKTLIRHGNSLALVIDKPILDMLHISADTPLELTTNGDLLLVSPVRDKARQQKLRESLDKINRKFGDDLKHWQSRSSWRTSSLWKTFSVSTPTRSPCTAARMACTTWACSNRPLPSPGPRSAASSSARTSSRWPPRTCSTSSRTIRSWTATNGRALSALVFLDINGVEIDAPKGSLYEITLSVAMGEAGKAQVAEFFRLHAQ